MKVLIFTLCIAAAGAFAPMLPSVKSVNHPLRMADKPLADLQEKVQELMGSLNTDGLTSNMDAIKANLQQGTLGSRGESYTIAQFALLACILGGGIPILGDALMLLLGPGLLIAGAAVVLISFNDLGDALSPWPVPSENGIKTGGLYSEMRHPMYAGSLAACAGLSIITGSATRLLLTAALLYMLDIKSDYEEKELVMKYPDYDKYQATVRSKFFPDTLMRQLPWTKEE
jgi:protein-S-isoprenylcysteine O-methyltransferase Ste14